MIIENFKNMSSDNAIFYIEWCGEWFVWHGSLSADYYEPASYEHSFQTQQEAIDFARKLAEEIGYVEGGIIQVTTRSQKEALIQHIQSLTGRLLSLEKSGAQYPHLT